MFWSRSEFKNYILVEVRVKILYFGRGQSLKNIFWSEVRVKKLYFGRGQSLKIIYWSRSEFKNYILVEVRV